MTAYVTITDVETDPDAPLTAVLGKKWRDNPIAITEGSTGAEYMQTSWHPYNSLKVGDANDGRIWSFAIDGAVTSKETPNFIDGYEYRLELRDLDLSAGANVPVTINLYRETSAAYAGAAATGITLSSGNARTGYIDIFTPREVSRWCAGKTFSIAHVADSIAPIVQGNTFNVAHTTAQKVLKATVAWVGGVISAGSIHLMRRRVY